ncbi:MAG TPA: DUF2065 domain-containing protein [Gammaproteobacteria bacterium]|nr:DUF2065 domain-containing protein [Gammaproteobacteria bacterium]
MDWRDLFVAIALVLVIEGLIPFASPGRYRRLVQVVGSISARQLRLGGLALMIVGLVLLYLVRR